MQRKNVSTNMQRSLSGYPLSNRIAVHTA